MKRGELLKLLKKYGICFVSHGGSHDMYFSPITKKYFMIPRHAKEIATGTARKILKDAGIRTEE